MQYPQEVGGIGMPTKARSLFSDSGPASGPGAWDSAAVRALAASVTVTRRTTCGSFRRSGQIPTPRDPPVFR